MSGDPMAVWNLSPESRGMLAALDRRIDLIETLTGGYVGKPGR